MSFIYLFLTPSFGIGSGNKSAIVTNTTVEIIVPENVIGSVYGENGSNLARLRQVYFIIFPKFCFDIILIKLWSLCMVH